MGGKKGKEYEQRKSITDEQGVLIPSGSRTNLYSSISEIFVADLLSEGEIEGIVSGDYIFKGDVNSTGYRSAEFLPYTVQGTGETPETELGFLKSVFWNEVPVVDSQGYYNYPEINIQEEKGAPVGKVPSLNSNLSENSPDQLQNDMQIALHRNIGDRLFGPPIEVGEKAPGYYKSNQGYISKGNASFWYSNYHSEYGQNVSEQDNASRIYAGIAGVGTDTRRSILGDEISLGEPNQKDEKYSESERTPDLKGERIDRNAKTYSISNKECSKVAVNIRVPNLAEQIKDDTTDAISNDSKKFSSQRKGTSQSGKQQPYGQGDLRARKIRYQVFFRPVFDTRHSKASFFQEALDSSHEILVGLLGKLGLVTIGENGEAIAEQKLSEILNENGFSLENNTLPNLGAGSPLKEFIVNIVSESKESFPWKQAYEDEIFGRFDQPYIRSRTVNLESYGIDIWNGNSAKDYELFQGWEIKILRTTPDSVHTYLRNQSFVDSLVEIYKPKMRYPYCAMVYSKFGADNFTNAPARSYDARLIKVKIPNNYDPIKKTYGISSAFVRNEGEYEPSPDAKQDGESSIPIGSMLCYDHDGKTFHKKYSGDIKIDLGDHEPDYVSTTDNAEKGTDPNQFWNGEFKSDKYWTDNPAWCFYDLMTNFRYGLGEYINVEAMDKWTLYDISKYCDVLVYDNKGSVEPRFTFNHLIISRDEAYKVLNDLASAFRSMLYYAFGQIYVVQDKPRDPVYHFNNANVIDGKFNYSSSARKARHTVALVRYIDKHSMYKPALSYTEDPEGIRRYGIREVETTAIGCTSEAQAKRFGDWMLKSETLETESITFSAGIEVSYLRPGDIFSVYDRYRNKSKFLGRTLNIEEECVLQLTDSQKDILAKEEEHLVSSTVELSVEDPPEDSPENEEEPETPEETITGVQIKLEIPYEYYTHKEYKSSNKFNFVEEDNCGEEKNSVLMDITKTEFKKRISYSKREDKIDQIYDGLKAKNVSEIKFSADEEFKPFDRDLISDHYSQKITDFNLEGEADAYKSSIYSFSSKKAKDPNNVNNFDEEEVRNIDAQFDIIPYLEAPNKYYQSTAILNSRETFLNFTDEDFVNKLGKNNFEYFASKHGFDSPNTYHNHLFEYQLNLIREEDGKYFVYGERPEISSSQTHGSSKNYGKSIFRETFKIKLGDEIDLKYPILNAYITDEDLLSDVGTGSTSCNPLKIIKDLNGNNWEPDPIFYYKFTKEFEAEIIDEKRYTSRDEVLEKYPEGEYRFSFIDNSTNDGYLSFELKIKEEDEGGDKIFKPYLTGGSYQVGTKNYLKLKLHENAFITTYYYDTTASKKPSAKIKIPNEKMEAFQLGQQRLEILEDLKLKLLIPKTKYQASEKINGHYPVRMLWENTNGTQSSVPEPTNLINSWIEAGNTENGKEFLITVFYEKVDITQYITEQLEEVYEDGKDDNSSKNNYIAENQDDKINQEASPSFQGELFSDIYYKVKEENNNVEVIDVEGLSEEEIDQVLSNNLSKSFLTFTSNIPKSSENKDELIKTLGKALNENVERYLIFESQNEDGSTDHALFYYKDHHGDFQFLVEETDPYNIKIYGVLTKEINSNYTAKLNLPQGTVLQTINFSGSYIEGDCITLDRPINLTDNVKYNLSILTPSFNYENNEERIIDGLDSRDSKDIRKSFVQKLEFWGFQAIEETGNYYSEINDENGKGIVTKIIFNKDEESSRLNRLDFNVNPNGKHVWSIEPDFEGCEIDYSDTAVSGHLMNDHLDYYRIINIKEEENQYEINALQYSFSKYSDSDCHDAYLDSNSTYCEVNE